MMRRVTTTLHSKLAMLLVVSVMLIVTAGPALAADVSIEISSREVWVGMPFRVTISIRNGQDYETPAMPEVEGVRFIGPPSPSTNSMTQIVNGRMTQSRTVTLSWQAVADAVGEYVIPPISVIADGEENKTRPLRFIASKSETGDLLFVELDADRDTYYLGESIDLTLQIWLRPYRDRELDVSLGKQDMWRVVDKRASNWDVFADSLDSATVREAMRQDGEGNTRAYFVYEIAHRFTPQQAGQLGLSDVSIVVNYPERLQSQRDFFGGRSLSVASSRPLVASVGDSTVQILNPPVEGRPDFYAGAVGRFDMAASAKPTEVSVGDPITITLQVIDRTRGGAPLDLLQPPPLDRVPELVEDFKIPDDPLAGVVTGSVKTFTQTVRARHDQIEEIPSIPFAAFDPRREEYVVMRSDPIPITVNPVASVSMAEVVEAEQTAPAAATELTESVGGLLANYTDVDDLLAVQEVTISRPLAILVLGLPPLAYLTTLVVSRRIRRLRGDTSFARRRKARTQALDRIRRAAAGDPDKRAERTGAAVRDYVADKCGLGAGAVTSPEVIERLEADGVGADLVKEVQSLLLDCEQMVYAGGAESDAADLPDRAGRCIRKLEGERLR